MKKNIIIFMLLALPMLGLMAQTDGENLGLVNYLMQIKYQNELELANGIHTNDSVKVIRKFYNAYVTVNSFISQLQADMIASNSLKTYNKLDKLLKQNDIKNCASKDKIIQNYIEKLNLLSKKEKTVTATLATISSLLDLTSKGVSIYKEIQEIKATKVSNICAILEKLRLENPIKEKQVKPKQ